MNNSAKQIAVTEILSIAKKAGEAIMKIYEKDFSVEYKDDKSPLTEADTVSNKIIVEALANYTPDIPVISEENKLTEYEVRSKWDLFWLIDPIDGTKEFIKKNGEFTVNIALIENGIPVLGVVYVPAQKVAFYGMKDDGSFKVTESGVEKLYPGEHYSKKRWVS